MDSSRLSLRSHELNPRQVLHVVVLSEDVNIRLVDMVRFGVLELLTIHDGCFGVWFLGFDIEDFDSTTGGRYADR